MTTINHHNYEEFALDYLEGTLQGKLRTEFEVFLAKEPSIKADLDLLENFTPAIPDKQIVFERKSPLLKKEGTAKVIALNTNFWYKVTAVVAAIGLLLIGYFTGYNNGYQDNLPLVVENHSIEIKNSKEIKEIEENIVIENSQLIATQKEIITADKTEIPNKSIENIHKKIILPLEKKQESQKDENEMIAENTTNSIDLSQGVQQELINFENQVLIIPNLLSSKSLQPINYQPLVSMEDKAQYLTEINQIMQHPNDLLVKTPSPQKRSRLRDLFGKLPFDGVSKESFIPSYFTE